MRKPSPIDIEANKYSASVIRDSGDSNRRKIWLHQFVHFFGSEAWIPYSIGLITAHCRINKEFDRHFEIMDFKHFL